MNIAELILTPNARHILEKRYLKRDLHGLPTEKPEDLFRRVAHNIALAEAKYKYKKKIEELQKKYRKEFYDIVETKEFKALVKDDKDIKKAEEEFYQLMISLEFLPNSPTLFNAGRQFQQLCGCFVLPIEDDIGSIFDTLANAARIHRTGAGTGFNFSRIRPRGDPIGDMGYTTGPVSFMKMFDAATEEMKKGGIQRGANMAILNINHPDIEEFITVKNEGNLLTNFNISVGIFDSFMKAVKEGRSYPLINPRTRRKVREVNAKKIFALLCEMAWKNGDPGVIFLDRLEEFNPTPKAGRIESTDSCGEQPLLPYESCNLGSINLSGMVENGQIGWDKLKAAVHKAVHFLDNVIDMSKYPLKETLEIVHKNRKIGLGVMGFADLLIELGAPYNSEKAVEIAEGIMAFIKKEAAQASIELAKIRGVFQNWKYSVYSPAVKLRNATRTTIAPTGTISILADASSSIEPLFALSYVRKLHDGKELFYINRKLKEALERKGLYTHTIQERIAKHGSIQHMPEIPETIRKLFVISYDISPEYHIKIQSAFQRHVDNAVSKTVILPNSASIQDVEKAYWLAYSLGCKGVSIYRQGSRKDEVLYLSRTKEEQSSLRGFIA